MENQTKVKSIEKQKEVCFKCLDILLKNKNISENDWLFLKEFSEEKNISKVAESMFTITDPRILNLTSFFDCKTVNFYNLSKNIKNEIRKQITEIIQEQKIPEKNYCELAQNKATNSIIKLLSSKHKKSEFDFIGNLEVKIDNSIIQVTGIQKTKTSTSKFLDFLMLMWVENGRNDKTIRVHLKEYLKLRGKKDTPETRKELRKEIKESLTTIENIKITFTTEKGKEKLNIKLNGGTSGINNGFIHFNFNKDFLEYLNEIPKQFMYAPKELFTFNDKYNPHSYYLLRKACLHMRMNTGKLNENIISVKSLLDYCPKFESYKNYTNDNHKRLAQLIIEPFERDMDAIKSFSWNYKNNNQSSFNEFIQENIVIEWHEYPREKVLEFKKTSKKLGG